MTSPSSRALPTARRALLAWFDREARDLPWRRQRTPYRVWLAEVMLQQTQVSTVVPYFQRFLARFPTVEALAAAALPQVLAEWKGLGYYSRARNLHAAAQQLARDGFPRTAAELRGLPGFGRYTAAAVASLAFGERAAVLDGNVARVLARFDALEGAPGDRARDASLWARAEELLDPDRPGAFNEALMELGALVCTPANPRCDACPWQAGCLARAQGRQQELPAARQRPARTRLELASAVVLERGRLLLARRPERGLFGGLWELPSAEESAGSGPAALRELGLTPTSEEPFATVRRTLTHRDLVLHLYRCADSPATLPGYLEVRRVMAAEQEALGVSTAMARALALARSDDGASPKARPARKR